MYSLGFTVMALMLFKLRGAQELKKGLVNRFKVGLQHVLRARGVRYLQL